jgi:quercetin dioxygenase-like cupin family protein
MNPTPPSVQVRHAAPDSYVSALPGIRRHTMVEGRLTQLAEFRLARGSVIPVHQHPQEQTGYLVSGRLLFNIAGTDHEVRPGDAWTIPGGVDHGARVLEDSVVVEVFSPPRDDYRRA